MENESSGDEKKRIDFFNLHISAGPQAGNSNRWYDKQDGYAQRPFLPANTSIAEIIRQNDVSVRVKNCISVAAQKGILPVETIGEYHQLGIAAKDAFLSLPEFGRKSAFELYELLNSFKLGSDDDATVEEATSTNMQFSKLIADKIRYALKDVTLPELITPYPVSARVYNFFNDLPTDATLDHGLSLSDYLEDPVVSKEALSGHRNLGSKSINEIHALVSEWMMLALLAAGFTEKEIRLIHSAIFDMAPIAFSESEKLLILSKIEQFDFVEYSKPNPESLATPMLQEFDFAQEQSLLSKIEQVLKSFLDDRQKDVVLRRRGFSGSKETLEEVAQSYGITRERVRQIEKKAIRKCRLGSHIAVFRQLLFEEKDVIRSKLFKDGAMLSSPALKLALKDLSKTASFLIEVVNVSVENWLSHNFHEVNDSGITAAWTIDPDVSVGNDISLIGYDISHRIKVIIEKGIWPLPFKDLVEQIIDVPPSLLETVLKEQFQAKIENATIVSIGKLPISTRLILVLRMAGHGLEISEIAARYKKLFGLEIDESGARACLGRLEEALIVDRGKYDLYENLKFEASNLAKVRDLVFDFLSERGQFVSTKNIHADVFLHRMRDFPERLTDYMLLGILQDDSRFDVRRGLMVGLSQDSFDGDFRPLSDEIWDIVNENGPLSTAEIKKQLSITRNVLDTSIGVTLQNTRDIAANKDGLYDKVERIFESVNECEQARQAIVINLLGGEVSLFVLKERLESIGIKLGIATLRSLIQSDENIEYSGRLASLLSIDESVKKYDELITTAVKNGKQMQEIKNIFEKFQEQSNEVIVKLVRYSELDGRLSLSENGGQNGEEGLLDNILNEFDPS